MTLDPYLLQARITKLEAENEQLRVAVRELDAERRRLQAQIEPLRMDTLREPKP